MIRYFISHCYAKRGLSPRPLWERVRVRGEICYRAPSPQSSPIKGEEVGSCIAKDKGVNSIVMLIATFLLAIPAQTYAQKLEQIISDAKKEGEVTLLASASTFGGKKGFAELENHFAKRYGFKGRINLAGGPSFPQVAARIITEQKAGAKSSTDL